MGAGVFWRLLVLLLLLLLAAIEEAMADATAGLTLAGVLMLRWRCINCWMRVRLSERGGGPPGGGGGMGARVRLGSRDPGRALLTDALLLAAGGGPGGGGGIPVVDTDREADGGFEGLRVAAGGVADPDELLGNEVCCRALGA